MPNCPRLQRYKRQLEFTGSIEQRKMTVGMTLLVFFLVHESERLTYIQKFRTKLPGRSLNVKL